MEKLHNYVRKTVELATQFFINPQTSQPNVSGLILAGSADFKTELSRSDMFDARLQAKILKVVDVSYGGENGFNQAIELSVEILSNVKFIQEKRLIGKYFEEISQDTGKYVFDVEYTLKVLEMGAVEMLIVWKNQGMTRFTLNNSSTGELLSNTCTKIKILIRVTFVIKNQMLNWRFKKNCYCSSGLPISIDYLVAHLSLLPINLKRALSFVEVLEELAEYFSTLMTFLMMEKFMTMMNSNQPTSQTQVQGLSGRPAPVREGSCLAMPLEGENFGRNLDRSMSHG